MTRDVEILRSGRHPVAAGLLRLFATSRRVEPLRRASLRIHHPLALQMTLRQLLGGAGNDTVTRYADDLPISLNVLALALHVGTATFREES